MSRLCSWIGAGLLFLSPALAAGQAPPLNQPPAVISEVQDPGGLSSQEVRRTGPTDLKKMYEDIEIMRRLLNRDLVTHQMGQCSSCHGPGTAHGIGFTFAPDPKRLGQWFDGSGAGMAFSPDGRLLATQNDKVVRLWDINSGKQVHSGLPDAHAFTGVEGTYLRGVGVVFTVTLPIPPENVSPPSSKPAPPPVSDWERVRRQVTGEGGAEPPAPVPGKGSEAGPQPSLRDVLLKTLADNGRHFNLLGPNETLTVVVTFRGNVHTSTTGSLLFGIGAQDTGSLGFYPPAKNLFAGAKSVKNPQNTAEKAALVLSERVQNPTSARDYELLGDLISKQGKLEEAIKAYQKAVELGTESKEQSAGLYRKLAQIYLQRSQDAQAMEVLKKAREFIAAAQNTSKGAKTVKTPASLPAQLVIVVPRELSDRFASGQLTLPQFRRAAHVELRKFTAEK